MTDRTFFNPLTGKPLHKVPVDATIPADTPYGYEEGIGSFVWVGVLASAHPPENRAGDLTYFTAEPIAPPMPSLPTKPGSLIRATGHDGGTCEVVALSTDGIWYGVDQGAELRLWEPAQIASWEPVLVLPNGFGVMDETDKRDMVDRSGDAWKWSEARGSWYNPGSPFSLVRGTKALIAREFGPLSFREER